MFSSNTQSLQKIFGYTHNYLVFTNYKRLSVYNAALLHLINIRMQWSLFSLFPTQVEVYLLGQGPKSTWQSIGSDLTDKHGKLTFTLPEEKRLPIGLYPLKFLVK